MNAIHYNPAIVSSVLDAIEAMTEVISFYKAAREELGKHVAREISDEKMAKQLRAATDRVTLKDCLWNLQQAEIEGHKDPRLEEAINLHLKAIKPASRPGLGDKKKAGKKKADKKKAGKKKASPRKAGKKLASKKAGKKAGTKKAGKKAGTKKKTKKRA